MRKYIYYFLLFELLNHTIVAQDSIRLMLHRADSLVKTDADESISIAKKIREEANLESKVLFETAKLLGRAYNEVQQYDSAMRYLMEEKDYANQFKDSTILYYTYMDIAWIYAYRKEYQKSLKAYLNAKKYYNAYAIAEGNNRKSKRNYAYLLNNIGGIYIKLNKYDSALTYLYASLELRKKMKAPAKMIIINEYSIGNCYIEMQDFEKAEEQFRRLVSLTKVEHDSNFLAKSYTNLGIVFTNKKKYPEAIRNYQNAIQINKSINNEKSLAHSYLNIGNLYQKVGEFSTAREYITKALNIFNRLQMNASSIYLSLGELAIESGRLQQGIDDCKKALSQAKESGDLGVQLSSCKLLYKAFKMKGEYRESLLYHEKMSEIQNFTMEENRRKYAEKLKEEFETEKKRKEIEYLKAINASEKRSAHLVETRHKVIIFSAILILVFLGITLLSIIQKRKKEKLLHHSENKRMASELLNSQLEKDRLDEEIRAKTKELTTHTLNMIQKNQLIKSVLNKLDDMNKDLDDTQKVRMTTIIRELENSKKSNKDWELFKYYFESIHKEFNDKLRSINPKLNIHDYRLAALIFLNLNIKESATLLNISPNSVKVARYRLRKRLGVRKDEDLYVFLHSL